jgi:hypothetical protein
VPSAPSPAERVVPRRIDGGLLVLAVLALLALVAVGWGISMRQELADAKDRAAELQSEVDQLRTAANATAYTLSPSADAPPNAAGTAFFSLDGAGVIALSNLAALPDGRRYQVWFYPTPEAEPIPGESFTVNETGAAFLLIPADVGIFTNLSVTLEPETGSSTPTGPVILTGATGGARG